MALDFAAGCLGGCAGVVVGHPLDTVKVHLQTQGGHNTRYKGTLHCLRSLAAKEGLRGLYRGMSSPLAGVAAINAIVFGVYGNTQRRLNNPDSLSSHFLAGCLAGLVQSGICSPMELAKSRVQISGDGSGPLQCIKNIYKTEGVKGIFRGLGVTTVREVPAFGTYFVAYEFLTRTEKRTPASTGTLLLAGGIAGSLSWLVVYPVDVVKSRLQVDGMSGSPKYRNAWDCFKKSVANEGYWILGRGLTSTLLRAFPTNAACFTVVSWTLRVFSNDGTLDVAPSRHMWVRCGDTVTSLTSVETTLSL